MPSLQLTSVSRSGSEIPLDTPYFGQADPVRSFGVSAFGTRILVETDSGQAYRLLRRLVFPSLGRVQFEPGSTDLRIRVLRGANEFQLLVDNQWIRSAAEPSGLMRSLIDCLDRAVVGRLTELYAVHAGAVLIGGRALLLPGASHSGKSSLVPELLRRGARCFSDEYALIDRDGRVHAYPRPLVIRCGEANQLFASPEEFASSIAENPAPVGWILSLQYNASSPWNVCETSQSQGLMSLLQNTPHIMTDNPEMMSRFHRAVYGARCYAGYRGEARDAAGEIQRLVVGAA